jgi:PAS domain S-box-containing protein
VLGALALALNLVEVSVLTEETPQFVFGGALVLVAFVLLGVGPGLLAAVISILRLVAGDAEVGWLVVIYVLEAWVAYLLWQRWRSLLLGVLCFWLTAGWLLDIALYHLWIGLQPAYVVLLFVKQLFNGLLNATLAEGLLFAVELLPLGWRQRFVRVRPPEPLRAFVFNRLTFVLVLPALAVGSLYARTAYGTQLAGTLAEQLRQAGDIADELRALVEEWHRDSADAVRGLAASGWSEGSVSDLPSWRERRPELLALARVDAEGRMVESVTAWPGLEVFLSDEAISTAAFASARESRQTLYGPVRLAPGGGKATDPELLPVLSVVEPLFRGGLFDGVEALLLDGRALRPLLDRAAVHGSDTIVLFDDERSVIAAVGLALPAGTPLETLVPRANDLAESGARTLSFYGPPAASRESRLGIDLHYAAFYPVRPLGYGLLVGQSASHLYQGMVGASARIVGFLVGLLALSYAVVVWVGRRIGGPLHAVHAAAADIAAGRSEDAGSSLRRLVASPIEEIRVTAAHLEEMRGTLAQKETGREERLRLAADIARLVTLEWEPGTDSVVAGGRAREVFGGAPPTDRRQLAERIDPRDRERVMAELDRLSLQRRHGVLEFRITRPPRDATRSDWSDSGDGEGARETTRWLTARAEVIRGEEGRVARVLCVATDVTEQRRAEAALRESEERYRALFDNVPIGIGLTDARGNLVAFNDAMLRQGGFSRGDIVAETRIAEFYDDPEDRRLLLAELERTGTVRQREVRFRRKDGGTFVGVVSLQRVELDGEPYVLAMVEDTTARRQLQDQLLRAQKLEAVGRLSGGLAHDFNNLVTVILGCTELALKGIAADDPRRALLHSVEEAGRRAGELTRQLLAFSRRQVVQPRRVDLSELVLGFDRMLRRFLGEHIELVTRPGADLWACRVDPGQLEQVLVNLVLNARDAMPAGGIVTITTANLGHGGEDPRYPQMPVGDYVSLSVSDTGVGMSPEVLAQVFEPFFTTKPAGEGTGLGLATCYGIVKQAGGYIFARSLQNAGATVEVVLPRAEGRTGVEPQRTGSAASAPRGTALGPRGTERVLLVEDEPAVNRLAQRVLRDLGYTVHAAWSGEEAIGLLEHNGDIDLLLTDVRLPRGSGTDLAEQVRHSHPRAKILFMSGYVEELGGAFAEDGVAFLAKPFSPGDLASKVRSVLDATDEVA